MASSYDEYDDADDDDNDNDDNSDDSDYMKMNQRIQRECAFTKLQGTKVSFYYRGWSEWKDMFMLTSQLY